MKTKLALMSRIEVQSKYPQRDGRHPWTAFALGWLVVLLCGGGLWLVTFVVAVLVRLFGGMH